MQNTGQERDGSDSGARPDEAVSWGKILPDADSVKVLFSWVCPCVYADTHIFKVFADATLVLSLLVAATFAKNRVLKRDGLDCDTPTRIKSKL